jgi:ABC-type thiamine transport system ATPase subunit
VLNADVEVDRRDFTVRASIAVPPGGRLALFGPSGAGKTTILEVIAGLVAPRRGRVVLGERVLTATSPPVRAVPPWKRRVGLLRQDPALFPHLSVRANLAYGGTAGEPELAEMAGVLGLGGLLNAMPARLSGGQGHRVALGRLLLAPCDALLLDEPFTGLDASLRRGLTDLVAGLVTARGVPAVLVAHELADAQAFADRLAVLDRGELLQDGPPDEVVLRPASRRAAELFGYLGFVPVPVPGLPAGAGLAGIHPDRTLPGAHPNHGVVLTGTVSTRRPAGAGWEADVRVAGTVITCRLPDRPPDGEFVLTALDPPYFGPDGTAVPAPDRRPEQGPSQARGQAGGQARGPARGPARGQVRG